MQYVGDPKHYQTEQPQIKRIGQKHHSRLPIYFQYEPYTKFTLINTMQNIFKIF